MEMRELTDGEKRICEKQIKRMDSELKHVEWLLEYNQLMLDKGLRMNYEENVREFKEQKNALMGDIQMILEKKRTMLNQMKNGVEVKERNDVPTGVG